MSDNDSKWACKQHHNEFMLHTNPSRSDPRYKYGGYVESCPACAVADAERVRCENQRARSWIDAPLFRERIEARSHMASIGRTVIRGGAAAPAVDEDRCTPVPNSLVEEARLEAARIRLGKENPDAVRVDESEGR